MGHIIQSVPEGCLAAELGLVPGDELVAINGEKIIDLIDYQAMQACDDMTITYLHNGEELEVSCEKEEWEELGVEFTDDMLVTRVCKTTAFSASSTRCPRAAERRFMSRMTIGACR